MNTLLTNHGMNTLIKSLSLIFLMSCSVISELQYLGQNQGNFAQSTIDRSKNIKYKIAVRESRFNYDLYTKISSSDELWSNDSNVMLKVCDFRICFYKENSNEYIANFNINITDLVNNEKDFYKNYIQFINPNSGYMSQISKFKVIEEGKIKGFFNNQEYYFILLEEEFNVPKIKWSGVNLYYLDKETFEVIKISQSISPFKKNITLFYK